MKARNLSLLAVTALTTLVPLACGAPDEPGESLGQNREPVSAPLSQNYCQVNVTGTGDVEIEAYVAHVVTCENGGAGPEALKAQAVAARSVAYYNMATQGSICDGQGCQVYSCGRPASAEATAAAAATQGMYLSYGGMLTYGFYVDGDHTPDATTCVGRSGQPRESRVTYNYGKSGTQVSQTSLGYVGPPGFGQNRGCMAQWGARCLEDNLGQDYRGILNFYYGSDIQLLNAPGTCANQTEPTPAQQSGELQPMTRDEIIALASSGMGYSYWWGHGAWDQAGVTYPGSCSGSCGNCSHSASGGGPEYGADCSGFVAQVWQAPGPNPTTNDRHPYSTDDFRNSRIHWDPIPRADAKRGDAFVYRSGGRGHIVIFESWAASGQAMVYECAGCSTGCVHRVKSLGPAYIAIKRHLVNDETENREPRGRLDMATCDRISGWAADPDYPDAPIDVELSFDGPRDDANAQKLTVSAGETREDLCSQLGSCDHGFTAQLPDELRDGNEHQVYAYAVDPDGGRAPLLVGAPQTVRCNVTSAPECNTDDDCYYGERCDNHVCVTDSGDVGTTCFGINQDCGGGKICAWNGDGYCCRTPAATGTKCFSDSECGGQVCSYNGDGFFCTAAVQCGG